MSVYYIDHFFLKVSSRFIVVFIIFSTADYSFRLLIISTVRENKKLFEKLVENKADIGMMKTSLFVITLK